MTALEQIHQVNSLVQVHSMWDGFWIRDFDHGTLTISASFDFMYYRNYDILFEGVTFFNLPDEWRDTNVIGDDIVSLSNENDFKWSFDDEILPGKHIFCIELCFKKDAASTGCTLYPFYIVADKVTATICSEGNNDPGTYYKDRFEQEAFPCMKNRVV